MQIAWILLTLFYHLTLLVISLDRSSKQHPVSAQNCLI